MLRYLTKKEVSDVVERKNGKVIPIAPLHIWWSDEMAKKYPEEFREMNEKYPADILYYNLSGCLGFSKINDWDLDFPVFLREVENFMKAEIKAPKLSVDEKNKYKVGRVGTVFHERFWDIRGMENLMCDYYLEKEYLDKFSKEILKVNKKMVDAFSDAGFEAIISTDDLGHQTGPMMSPEIFHDFYYPLYEDFVKYIHEKNMHFWLHSCGDNTLLFEDIVNAKVDVFHPVQKNTMDFKEISHKYANRITFLTGLDVQHILIEENEENVEQEILNIIECFHDKNYGGLIFGAGNAVTEDTPIKNVLKMMEVWYRYR